MDLNSICFTFFFLKSPKTTTAQPEITDAASSIGILAFYSVIIIGVTIAFIAWFFDRTDFFSAISL